MTAASDKRNKKVALIRMATRVPDARRALRRDGNKALSRPICVATYLAPFRPTLYSAPLISRLLILRMVFTMTHCKPIVRRVAGACSFVALAMTPAAQATVVEFQTVLGSFSVNLFVETTPATVTNFLDYVNNGAYTDSIFHRSVPDFVIQGGGFTYGGTLPLATVPANAAVANEPELSNVRGTIAMAKIGGQPDSATTQWFISLVDNSGDLDGDNGGFTVFGVVMDNGMDVVDAIAALDRFNFGGALAETPLRDYTDTTVDPDGDNFALVSDIVVTDTTVSTNTNLLPPVNVTINPPTPVTPPSSGGGGGGAFGLSSLFLMGGLLLRRRRR